MGWKLGSATIASMTSGVLYTPEMTMFSLGTPTARQISASPGEQISKRWMVSMSSLVMKVLAFTA